MEVVFSLAEKVEEWGLKGHLASYPAPALGLVGNLGGESFSFFGACGETGLREKGQDAFLSISGKYYMAEELEMDISTLSTKLWPDYNSMGAAKALHPFIHSHTYSPIHSTQQPRAVGKSTRLGIRRPSSWVQLCHWLPNLR